MVGKRKREVTGIVLNYFYALGEAVVALIAYYSRDWVLLQVTVSAPAILFVAYYWYNIQIWIFFGFEFIFYRIVPESVRWLLANRKNERAKEIVCTVAKVNKVTLSSALMDSFKENTPLTVG